MNTVTKKIAIALLALGALLVPASQASAAQAPAWRFDVSSVPTNLVPGSVFEEGNPSYMAVATNVGTAPTEGPVTITDTLPAGLTLEAARPTGEAEGSCSTAGSTATCVFPGPIHPGEVIYAEVGFDVDGTGTILHEGDLITDQAIISGGGTGAVVAENTTEVSSTPAPFEFLPGIPGFGMSPYAEDGTAETLAGGHPHVMTVNLSFSTEILGSLPQGTDGGVRDINVYLPHGTIVNPTATPRRCSEVQLEAYGCPANSQIGVVNVGTSIGSATVGAEPLYNMEPAPGKASNFGFVVIFFPVHIEGGVRAGDYTEMAEVQGIPDLFGKPTMSTQVLFWGDPSAPSFDYARRGTYFGDCEEAPCPVPEQDTPALSMPTSCAEAPVGEAEMVSWEHPNGPPVKRKDTLRDANGNEIGTTGCAGLEFNPTLKARPTTSVADSPSGLEVDLGVPQTDSLSERATAHLRKTVVTLPEGLVVNPSGANGLAGCSSAQLGIDNATAVPNGNPVTCPDASRIGSVEVDTPLVDHPLAGSVYAATPHDNPFGSLLAIYAVIDDKPSGILIKLPGHVVPDPNTGRLVATFDNNPQLPFSHFKLNFFGGAHGVLRTPSTCGNYSTTSEMTPWSAPDSGPPATPKDDYSISTPPAGGGCGASLANAPSLDAGVVSPVAAKYSPFVLHLRRGDGTQPISSFTTKLPPGLTGKLAGVAQCSDAELASAATKTGAQEQASPSCPASSHLGSVVAGAGAGPSPFYANGNAYLAGPYKGAPLSLAVITPAVAGPYDLGTIVVRAALRVDGSTGQITAESDPIPSILQGIPLDVRSIDVQIDRPQFSLTGTSCDPSSFEGSATSTLGQVAPLTTRYQLGECQDLAFKPKLGIRLFGSTKRGGHPALKGTVTMPAGGANIAQASVALPHSEFLDQSHIGTVCTRVQFAEGDGNGSNCPPASIYGSAKATSPLVDYTLEGPAILRSSTHKLPDLVVALHGPPSQPIAVDVAGRIDSVNGGIRTTFEGVPDLPVSSFVLSMQGGKKGLLQNSTNVCKAANKATALLAAQNGKGVELRPELKNSKCGKAKKKSKGKKSKHSHKRPSR
ncbi:MAG TPA: hypothetical protein VG816_14595 [Solirubrobacterales bacterium]|nr:hypothetical protein [Solirubrobacterales bacterium]